MISVLVDSQHPAFDYYENMSKKYNLNKGFEHSESFSTILAQNALENMSNLEVTTKIKLLTLVNLVTSKVNREDFKKFCSIENKKKSGGIRSISVPEENIEDHILLWSKMYGMIAISRYPMEQNDTIKMNGDFFIAFDSVPPFIVATNTDNIDGNFNIIKDSVDDDKDQQLAEVLAEYSQMIFDKWEQYGKDQKIEPKYNFSFIYRNKSLEC